MLFYISIGRNISIPLLARTLQTQWTWLGTYAEISAESERPVAEWPRLLRTKDLKDSD